MKDWPRGGLITLHEVVCCCCKFDLRATTFTNSVRHLVSFIARGHCCRLQTCNCCLTNMEYQCTKSYCQKTERYQFFTSAVAGCNCDFHTRTVCVPSFTARKNLTQPSFKFCFLRLWFCNMACLVARKGYCCLQTCNSCMSVDKVAWS